MVIGLRNSIYVIYTVFFNNNIFFIILNKECNREDTYSIK